MSLIVWLPLLLCGSCLAVLELLEALVGRASFLVAIDECAIKSKVIERIIKLCLAVEQDPTQYF